MARYLSIQAQQEPNDVGVDEDDVEHRQRCVFNVAAYKTPSTTFVEELLQILEDAGVGVQGEDLFGTSQPVWPTGDGPYLRVRATPGGPPVGTHNRGRGAYRRPGAQIEVRAATMAAANAMAQAAYEALEAVTNRTVEVAS